MELLYGFGVSGQNLSMNSNRLLVWGEEASSLAATPRLQGIIELSMHLFQTIAAGLIYMSAISSLLQKISHKDAVAETKKKKNTLYRRLSDLMVSNHDTAIAIRLSEVEYIG
jgi:copper homeostasis protein CutC